MCGICGTVRLCSESLIKRMCDVMRHRGPDDEGYYLDKVNKVALGVRRLSIIDVEGGHQPIHNEDGSVWLVFNGEIYNYKELRIELEKKGHRFYTMTDTETIVHLYEEEGEDCVKKLNGMFAFALWDRERKKMFIARDRLGIKPFYYTSSGGKFIFASEIKAILEYQGLDRETDTEGLLSYLTLQYVLAPMTMFKGIKKLLPGHILSIHNNKVEDRCYWDVDFFNNTRVEDEEICVEKIEEMFRKSVESRLISDVPLGALLSGGIDSSIVVAMMSSTLNRPVETFTVGFTVKKDYDETKYAREVASFLGTTHHELILHPKTAEILPKIIRHLDEPIADQAALPTYLICQLAKKHVTVVLTGEGGDELFAGYPRYILDRFAEFLHQFPHISNKSMIKRLINPLPFGSTLKRRMIKLFSSESDAFDRNVEWLSIFNKEELNALLSPHLKQILNNRHPVEDVRKYFKGKESLDRLIHIDMKTWLVDDILAKVDKMSMATSVEARVPFLDHKLVEYVLTLQPYMKLRELTTKYVLKKIAYKFLPKQIIRRKKQAFRIPTERWFREELRDMVCDFLLSRKSLNQGYFVPEYIKHIAKQHFDGREDNSQKLWNLLCFELWHRIYIENDKSLL